MKHALSLVVITAPLALAACGEKDAPAPAPKAPAAPDAPRDDTLGPDTPMGQLLDAGTGLYGELPKGWTVRDAESSDFDVRATRILEIGPKDAEVEALQVYVFQASFAESLAAQEGEHELVAKRGEHAVFVTHRGDSAEGKALAKTLGAFGRPALEVEDLDLVDEATGLWAKVPGQWHIEIDGSGEGHRRIAFADFSSEDEEAHQYLATVIAMPRGAKRALEDSQIDLFESETHRFVLEQGARPLDPGLQTLIRSLVARPVPAAETSRWTTPEGAHRLSPALGVGVKLPAGWAAAPAEGGATLKVGEREVSVGPAWELGPKSGEAQVSLAAVPKLVAEEYAAAHPDAKKLVDGAETRLFLSAREGADPKLVEAVERGVAYSPRPRAKGALQLVHPPSGLRARLGAAVSPQVAGQVDEEGRTVGFADAGSEQEVLGAWLVARDQAQAWLRAGQTEVLPVVLTSSERFVLFVDAAALEDAKAWPILASLTLR